MCYLNADILSPMKIPDVHGQELQKATGTWMVLGTQSLIDSTLQGHDYLVAELKA